MRLLAACDPRLLGCEPFGFLAVGRASDRARGRTKDSTHACGTLVDRPRHGMVLVAAAAAGIILSV
jgi:hypothetical protein